MVKNVEEGEVRLFQWIMDRWEQQLDLTAKVMAERDRLLQRQVRIDKLALLMSFIAGSIVTSVLISILR